MAMQMAIVRDVDAAQSERPPSGQAMRVVSNTYPCFGRGTDSLHTDE